MKIKKNTATSKKQQINDMSTRLYVATLERNRIERMEKGAMTKDKPSEKSRPSSLWVP